MVVENPRTGVDVVFVREPRYDPDVFVLNNDNDDSLYSIQPVQVPEGADPSWTPTVQVYLEGPSDALSSRHLPPQLDLDDWPIAFITFANKFVVNISDTYIDAEIHTLTPAAFPIAAGDFDADGDADAADYAVWRSTFGSTEWLDADANGNAQIDAADYVVWRSNLSGGSGGEVQTSVPEPASALLFIFAATLGGYLFAPMGVTSVTHFSVSRMPPRMSSAPGPAGIVSCSPACSLAVRSASPVSGSYAVNSRCCRA
jgi:hypothetical protein